MLSFTWPWIGLLLPLPLLVYWAMPRATRLDAALFVPFFKEVQGGDRHPARAGGRLATRLLLGLIWVLLLLAASRPQWVGEAVALPASGRDLMLGVDISGSMDTPDMLLHGSPVARIDLVKKVVNEFIDRRQGDRVGLLLFGTEPYIQAPLTFDRPTVKTLLAETQTGFAGKKTAIGDAIGLAVKHLKERPANSRVLVLLTDGNNTAGNVEPLQAAKLAAQTEVRIHTIGVGADEMTIRTFFGNRRVNPSADLDEATLQEIAKLTGGQYFRARNPTELEKVYQLIDQLEPVPQEDETFRPTRALCHWPLAGALLVSLGLAGLHAKPMRGLGK
ncbi:MAG: BatB protein [Deltaproteobacteria bacterium CG_4_10_14_3_um_filter_60_8]|nr:MAG: BatB protein [Desulfobacterales bacterium CG2_30_60_27]PIY24669.1 MAG: BatB protein [Deltaproteobacteria bacterium CG_4_10_14_3_um_filter_60_8]